MKATASRRSTSYQRRNFTLRSETADLLDRLPREVNRSKLVDAAINTLVGDRGRATLRKFLEQGYVARAARDLRMVEEWFVVDEEAWQPEVKPRPARK